MNWDDVLKRLKDARTWTMLTSLANAAMVYFGVDSQVIIIADGALALVAFLLFGVEPIVTVIRRLKAGK